MIMALRNFLLLVVLLLLCTLSLQNVDLPGSSQLPVPCLSSSICSAPSGRVVMSLNIVLCSPSSVCCTPSGCGPLWLSTTPCSLLSSFFYTPCPFRMLVITALHNFLFQVDILLLLFFSVPFPFRTWVIIALPNFLILVFLLLVSAVPFQKRGSSCLSTTSCFYCPSSFIY